MFVTSETDREGLLVAVISGGRPRLSERPTAKFLKDLEESGFRNIIWVVSEKDAPSYERDDYEVCVYSNQWAHDYAANHWMSTDPVPPVGGFYGAFPGREWACLEAERRGCWGVLQLDDNIVALSFARDTKAGLEIPRKNRRMATHADLICAIALSTNARMAGGSLSSIPDVDLRIARTGFCYSLFVERVGKGREHWYGPFEDDITHAYQYGTRHDGAVPAIAPLLLYKKEFKSTSGMRSNYNHKRALQLQRIFPETAKINVRRAKSCGSGGPRIFHTMLADAIRNPLVVKDHELYQKITNRLQELCEEWAALNRKYNREKMQRRVEKLMN